MAAIHEMREPETKKQLRMILGFFSYFRKYINAFANKAKLLTDLTAKRVPQIIALDKRAFESAGDAEI